MDSTVHFDVAPAKLTHQWLIVHVAHGYLLRVNKSFKIMAL